MIAASCEAVTYLVLWSVKFDGLCDTTCFVVDSILLEGMIRARLYKQQELVFKRVVCVKFY